MAEPLFSIITVVKNNARGLRLTGKSIAGQMDAPRFEWIIVDGASTDQTAEIAAQFAQDHVHFISDPDDGLYDAMNKGLDRASGRYVWFLNGGDTLADAYTLRNVARDIQGNLAPDFLYGDARENGRIKKPIGLHRYQWGQITHHQAMLYRRDLIGALRYDPDYKIAADYAFTLDIISRAQRPHYTPRVLCDFAEAGLSQDHAEQARYENYLIRRDLLKMPEWRNRAIYKLNEFVFFMRRKFPDLYWRLRASAKK